ncbi:DUF4426 domain-containing protein [Pseudomonas sp. G.S.17]|uniref:DUF4426 domain-containing protein n=1 Tax=Pseudomonas sp. G.S.17 TaxID=3137451 RepID=UPI00311C8CA5
MRRLAVFLCTLCLALPLMAADNAKPERKEQFGELTVHYNAFASSVLQPAIAEGEGLIRSKAQGVLTIAVLKSGKATPANVTGNVKDLTGREKTLTFKQSKDAVYYIAQFAVDPNASAIYTFTVNVKAGNEDAHSFSFNQEIYSGD